MKEQGLTCLHGFSEISNAPVVARFPDLRHLSNFDPTSGLPIRNVPNLAISSDDLSIQFGCPSFLGGFFQRQQTIFMAFSWR